MTRIFKKYNTNDFVIKMARMNFYATIARIILIAKPALLFLTEIHQWKFSSLILLLKHFCYNFNFSFLGTILEKSLRYLVLTFR